MEYIIAIYTVALHRQMVDVFGLNETPQTEISTCLIGLLVFTLFHVKLYTFAVFAAYIALDMVCVHFRLGLFIALNVMVCTGRRFEKRNKYFLWIYATLYAWCVIQVIYKHDVYFNATAPPQADKYVLTMYDSARIKSFHQSFDNVHELYGLEPQFREFRRNDTTYLEFYNKSRVYINYRSAQYFSTLFALQSIANNYTSTWCILFQDDAFPLVREFDLHAGFAIRKYRDFDYIEFDVRTGITWYFFHYMQGGLAASAYKCSRIQFILDKLLQNNDNVFADDMEIHSLCNTNIIKCGFAPLIREFGFKSIVDVHRVAMG